MPRDHDAAGEGERHQEREADPERAAAPRAADHEPDAEQRDHHGEPRPGGDRLAQRDPGEERRRDRRDRLQEEDVRDGRVVEGDDERARRDRGRDRDAETGDAHRAERRRSSGRDCGPRRRRNSATKAKNARPASCVGVSTESSRCRPPAVDHATAAAAMYSCPRRRARRAASRELAFLPGFSRPLGSNAGLDRPVQRDRRRAPLALELAALDEPEPVLAGDAAAEPHREVEQLLGRRLGARPLRLVAGIDQERGVEVAVARVAPAARREAVPLRRSRASPRSPRRAGRRARRCPRSPCRRARPGRRARRRRASARAPRSRRRVSGAHTESASSPSASQHRRAQARDLLRRAVDLGEHQEPVPRAAPGRSRPTGAPSPRRGTRAPRPGRPLPSTRASASQPAAVPSCSETTGATASGAGIRLSQTEVTTPSVPSEPTSRLLRS